jgi:hypothetical protein
MIDMEVVILIGDPWEVGEELGWPQITGALGRTTRGNLFVNLDDVLIYRGSRYEIFSISARHEGVSLDRIDFGSIACNFASKGCDPALCFTGSITKIAPPDATPH